MVNPSTLFEAELDMLHRGRTGSAAAIFRAPARVNLVGEHTDYSGGFCMPAALDLTTSLAVSRRSDGELRIYSRDVDDSATYPASGVIQPRGNGYWGDYVAGVYQQIARRGVRVPGADLTIAGNVPRNAGLSSSAALEVASALALLSLAGTHVPSRELALLCQAAENQFASAPCGIMDQFASVHGRAGHALALDCRSLQYELVPLPQNVRLVIINSMVKHSVAGKEYAERRSQVEDGVRLLQARFPSAGIRSLRDVSEAQLMQAQDAMPEVVFRRCRHVITDSLRVLRGAEMLRAGNVTAFGELLLEAHASYRDDFAASGAACDMLVDIAASVDGCYGARLTGGGFGGCIVAVAEAHRAEEVRERIVTRYREATGIAADGWVCRAAEGAQPEGVANSEREWILQGKERA